VQVPVRISAIGVVVAVASAVDEKLMQSIEKVVYDMISFEQ
jgi:hypothetical protein